MKECPERAELLAALTEAETRDGEAMLAHVAVCPRCAGYVADARRIGEQIGQLFSDNTPRAKGDCPGDETLLAHAEGALHGPEAMQVAEHLDQCETCLLWVAETRIAIVVAKPSAARTPRQLLSRGKRIAVADRHKQHPTYGPAQTEGAAARESGTERRTPVVRTPWVHLAYGLAGSAVACALLLLVSHYRGEYHELVTDRGIGSKPTRVVSVPGPESGPVLRGAPPAPVPGLDALVFWYRLQGSGQAVQVPMPSDSRISLTSRDEYGLHFRARADGWVYVFQVDSRGQLAQLFPLHPSDTVGNPVVPGRDYRLPGEGKAFQLDEVVGKETVYVVFARARRADWEEMMGVPQAAGGKDRQARVIADLGELEAAKKAYAIRFTHAPVAPK